MNDKMETKENKLMNVKVRKHIRTIVSRGEITSIPWNACEGKRCEISCDKHTIVLILAEVEIETKERMK
jgi:hypothetical protein